jgi:hypothetical protein
MKRKLFTALMLILLVCFVFASCEYLCRSHQYEDGVCTKCGKEEPTVDIHSKTPWETTNLIFQISENSNVGELASTTRRYLAGDVSQLEKDSENIIDTWVSNRNEEALKVANVTVSYEYIPDISKYCWGQNIVLICEEVNANEPDRPDIYCNFVFDMVAASLNGAFANLYSTAMYEEGHELSGAEYNYFDFTKSDYIDLGEGYLYDYMSSLTLSKKKMYCLASDYFTDLIRAELIVPVNISLLESLQAASEEGFYNSDRVTTYDNNGNVETNYTIEDFCQLVYDAQWTYGTLADFAAAVTTNDDGEEIDLRDNVGFALCASTGFGAQGLLYSSSFTIIDRVYDPEKDDYVHSYPYMQMYTDSRGEVWFNRDVNGTHEDFLEIAAAIYDLFSSEGVISINNLQTHGYGDFDLLAIRKRFASNNILFGTIDSLGSLEQWDYKKMNDEDGTRYGIAPVPIPNIKSKQNTDENKYTYSTQIYNIGKIGAISYTTEKFAQCTAYLNYLSTHSTEILNEYYDYAYQYAVGENEAKCNVEMLKFIRSNIHSNFDKTIDETFGIFYYEVDSMDIDDRWHTLFKHEGFRITQFHMLGYYDSLTSKKAWRLYDLENSIYPTLPN